MNLTTIVTLIGEVGVLIGTVVPVIVTVRKVANGTNVSCVARCFAYTIITTKAAPYDNMKMKTL